MLANRIPFIALAIGLLGCAHDRTRTTTPVEQVVGRATPLAPPPGPDVTTTPPIVATAMPDLTPLRFDLNDATISGEQRAELDVVGHYLLDHPTARLRILGYADERGTVRHNLNLGEERAEAARDILVSMGVDDSRIDLVSVGEEDPVDTGHGEHAWAKNRRVELDLRNGRNDMASSKSALTTY